jgi:Ca-activated chloride channel family protein
MTWFSTLLLLLVVFVEPTSGWQQTYTFDVAVDAVRLDVFVGRNGQPVTGLTADNFEVFDNGVRQEIQLLDTEFRLSTILVFDVSRSVRGEKYAHLKAAGLSFLEGLAEKDEAALVTFSHHIRLRSPLSHDRKLLNHVPFRVVGQGGTALYDAIFAGLKLAEKADERSMLLVFTDGENLHSRLTEAELLEVVKESSAVIYVVGIVPSTQDGPFYVGDHQRLLREYRRQTQSLRRLTEVSGARFLDASSSTELEEAFLRILSETKDRYLLSYTPTSVAREGWHKLEVKLKGVKANVHARRGYYASSPSR